MSTPENQEPDSRAPGAHARKGWFERQPDAAKAAVITGACAVVAAVIAGGGAVLVEYLKDQQKPPSSAAPSWVAATPHTTTTAPATSPGGTPATEPGTPAPGFSGEAADGGRGHHRTFNESYYIDLDSDQPNWDLSSSEKTGSDLGFTYLVIQKINIQGEATNATAAPDIGQCNSATARFDYAIEDEDFAAGKAFCVITTEKNWVWIKIVQFDLDADPPNVTLDIVPLGKVPA